MQIGKHLPDSVQRSVLRSAFYNLLGLGIPALVAIFSIPPLIHSLGEEKFGVLTIIWAVVSYFGLFDLGVGRAITQKMAQALADQNTNEVQKIVGTGSLTMLVCGMIGGALMALFAPLLAGEFALATDQGEVLAALLWMALAIPAIVMTSCYRGILEAVDRFALINIIRLPMGIFTFLAPLVVVVYVGPNLDVIAMVLACGRIIACIVHAWFALRSVPGNIGHGTMDQYYVPSLLKTGGWLTVSNIVAPLMNYVDRFILGIVASGAAVAYYATPQELLLRIGIIPSALATVLFPLFARNSISKDADRDRTQLRSYSLLIVVVMLPITVILLLFAHPLLSMWINPKFADNAGLVLQVMSVAALISGIAQIPYTMLQGNGRADITGKLHLSELPVYVALLCALAYIYGPIGAAVAWLIRIVADAGFLYFFNSRMLKVRKISNLSGGGVFDSIEPAGPAKS